MDIFSILQHYRQLETDDEIYRHKERSLRKCETRKEITQLNLVVSYIESIPPDMRTWEQQKELEWALEALWMYEVPEGRHFDRLQSIEEEYDYRIANMNIDVDLNQLKARIEETYPDEDRERGLRFIDLNTEISFIQDRLFGSLIQTSSIAHNLARGNWEIESLSTPERVFLSNLGIDTGKKTQSEFVGLFSLLGINADQKTQSEFVDLSSLYGPVKSQGESKACVGFSMADDIYFELNHNGKIQRHETLSPFSVYRSLQAYSQGNQPSHCLISHSHERKLYGGWAEGDIGVNVGFLYENSNGLFQPSFCTMNDWGQDFYRQRDTSVVSQFRVTDYETYSHKISFELIRALLDNNKPPILFVNTDIKRVTENWQEVLPSDDGRYGHTIVVVGYGMQGENPFTLKREPYFIVRDSLTRELIHYKVSAENLLEFTHVLIKVTGVERI